MRRRGFGIGHGVTGMPPAVDYPAGYNPALATDTTFNYDGAGNRTSVIDSGGTSTYVTNALNQYTSVAGVSYTYDPAGRRIEKKVDGATQVKYVYDGDHIIAEYNSAGTLLRKYVHGPCVDEPICMIEAGGTYAGTHYYHYDALGSCVAMTNSAGNVVQLYEYSVYGQVAASDANHPNRFMFTGREFDKDTGLYYYRARYYHPEIGRFLQTDPIGYGDGMNLYQYCRNGPLRCVDPSGCMTQCHWFVGLPDRMFGLLPPGWQEAFTLFSQWVRGEGPDEWVLGRGNALVEELIGTDPIETAMQIFRDMNAGKPLGEWTATEYVYNFGPMEVIEAGTNAALHFLGSFKVKVVPRTTEEGTDTIVVTNTVSWSSYWRWMKYFGFPVPQSWEREECQPCGNMRTTMTWGYNVLSVTSSSGCEWMGLMADGIHWRPFCMHTIDRFTPGIAYHPDVGVVHCDISRFY